MGSVRGKMCSYHLFAPTKTTFWLYSILLKNKLGKMKPLYKYRKNLELKTYHGILITQLFVCYISYILSYIRNILKGFLSIVLVLNQKQSKNGEHEIKNFIYSGHFFFIING